MSKKIKTWEFVVILLVFIIVIADTHPPEVLPFKADEPKSWTEDNIAEVSVEQLAKNPEAAKNLWKSIPAAKQGQLFENNFKEFKTENGINEYFGVKFGGTISGIQNNAGIEYVGGQLKNGNAFLDKDHFPSGATEAIAKVGGGFEFIYPGENSINLIEGTLDLDGKLPDGRQIIFSSAGQSATITDITINLQDGMSVSDSQGNLIIAEGDVTMTQVGDRFNIVGNSFGSIKTSEGILEFSAKGQFSYDLSGGFSATDGKVQIFEEFNLKDSSSISEIFDKQGFGSKNFQARREWYESTYGGTYTGTAQQNTLAVSDIKSGNVRFERMILEGSFAKSGDAFSLRSHGGQSFLIDRTKGKNVAISTLGHPVVIIPRDGTVPSEFSNIENRVSYGDDYFSTQGIVDVVRGDLHVYSEHKEASFDVDGSVMNAKGRMNVEDSQIEYEGLSNSAKLVRDSKDVDVIQIDGDKGLIAKFSRKIKTLDLFSEEPGIEKTSITMDIFKEKGIVLPRLDDKTIGLLVEIQMDRSSVLVLENDMKLELGDGETVLQINKKHGMIYEDSSGKTSILNPASTVAYLGNDAADFMKATALFSLGNTKAGIAQLEKIKLQNTGSKKSNEATLQLAQHYVNNKDSINARSQLLQLIKTDPNSKEAAFARNVVLASESKAYIEASLKSNDLMNDQWKKRLALKGFYKEGPNTNSKLQKIQDVVDLFNPLYIKNFLDEWNAQNVPGRELEGNAYANQLVVYDHAVLQEGLNLVSQILDKELASDIPSAIALIERKGKSIGSEFYVDDKRVHKINSFFVNFCFKIIKVLAFSNNSNIRCIRKVINGF